MFDREKDPLSRSGFSTRCKGMRTKQTCQSRECRIPLPNTETAAATLNREPVELGNLSKPYTCHWYENDRHNLQIVTLALTLVIPAYAGIHLRPLSATE